MEKRLELLGGKVYHASLKDNTDPAFNEPEAQIIATVPRTENRTTEVINKKSSQKSDLKLDMLFRARCYSSRT